MVGLYFSQGSIVEHNSLCHIQDRDAKIVRMIFAVATTTDLRAAKRAGETGLNRNKEEYSKLHVRVWDDYRLLTSHFSHTIESRLGPQICIRRKENSLLLI